MSSNVLAGIWTIFLLHFISSGQHGKRSLVCQSNICDKKSPLSCPQPLVVLVMKVICLGRNSCPGYIYNAVTGHCSFRTWCKNSLDIFDVLCQREKSITVTFTCVKLDVTRVISSCNNEILTDSSGFIASQSYPERSRTGVCNWILQISPGYSVSFVLYDLQNLNFGQKRKAQVEFHPQTSNNCGQTTLDKINVQDAETVKLPVLITYKCSKTIKITFKANDEEIQMLLYFRVSQVAIEPPARAGASVLLPDSWLVTSCKIIPIGRIHIFVQKSSKTESIPLLISKSQSYSKENSTIFFPTVPKSTYISNNSTQNVFFIGMNVGIGLSILLLFPLLFTCFRYQKQRRSSLATERSTISTDLDNNTSFPFTETKMISNNIRDSPIYATIDEALLDCPENVRLNDAYSEVADKLSNPAPAPLTPVTNVYSSGGNKYSDVVTLDPQSCDSRNGSPNMYIFTKPTDKKILPLLLKHQLNRCQSEPNKSLTIYSVS